MEAIPIPLRFIGKPHLHVADKNANRVGECQRGSRGDSDGGWQHWAALGVTSRHSTLRLNCMGLECCNGCIVECRDVLIRDGNHCVGIVTLEDIAKELLSADIQEFK